MSRIIGIDFGTTNSCISVIEGNKPIIIPNLEGNRLTPSIVALSKNGSRKIFGNKAKRQALLNPEQTIGNIKKIVGKKYHRIDAFCRQVSYHIEQDIDGYPKILLGNKFFTVQEIISMILGYLKLSAEEYLKTKITEAVITVPSDFSLKQNETIKVSGEIAGLTFKRIIPEPVAASLAYGLFKGNKNEKILVFDMGGGSLDISILVESGLYQSSETVAASGGV